MILKYIENQTIYLFTEVLYGSGDLFAAKKLIQEITQNAAPKAIHWFVVSPPTREDVPKLLEKCRQELGALVTISQLNIGYSNAPFDKNQAPNLVLFYPTAHYIQVDCFNQLTQFNVPIVHLYEYDGMEKMHKVAMKSKLVRVSSGFSHLGINLYDFKQHTMTLPSWYKPENTLLLSYANLEEEAVVNQASFSQFLEIALQIVPEDKSTDVVCNTPIKTRMQEMVNCAWDHGYSELHCQIKNSKGDLETIVIKNPTRVPSNKTLTIHNRFPLLNQELISLMTVAFPFMHVTGDQSLSEILSRGSLNLPVFPFYQIMQWKIDLYENLIRIAENSLEEECVLSQLLKMSLPYQKIDTAKYVAFWKTHEQALLEQSKKLIAVISQHGNFRQNSLRYLNWVLGEKNDLRSVRVYSRLVGHLIGKLSDAAISDCIATLVEHPAQLEVANALHPLCAFLAMNPIRINAKTLVDIINELMLQKPENRMVMALTAKKLLTQFSQDLQQENAVPIFSGLRRSPVRTYPSLEFHFKNEKKSASKLTAELLITKANNSEISYKKDMKLPQKKILLCVTVYSDGVGDLIKFIGIYRQLIKLQPNFEIDGFVYCADKQRKTILNMLRSSGLPLKNIVLVAQPLELQYIAESSKKLAEKIADNTLSKISYNKQPYALVMSVATPMEYANFLRKKEANQPYIELAEVLACSHSNQKLIERAGDPDHHFFTMGLADDSVGLELTTPTGQSNEELLNQLPSKFREKLIDRNRVKQFVEQALFIPCYTKNDLGYNSLYLGLSLLNHSFPSKSQLVMWLPNLPFDMTSNAWLTQVRAAKISQITYFDEKDNKVTIAIPGAIGNKKLRIICGTLAPDEFDVLFELASNLSGFAGCSGQNSFEKAISFGLIPSCIMPKHQIGILMETSSIARERFGETSDEYNVIDRFLTLLTNISTGIIKSKTICNTGNLLERKELKFMSHKRLYDELIHIDPAYEETLKSISMRDFDPIQELDNFFKTVNVVFFKTAWQQLCSHIRKTKNLNHWLKNTLEIYLPKEYQEDNQEEFKFGLTDFESANNQSINSVMPFLYRSIFPVLTRQQHYPASNINLVLTDAPFTYVDCIPGQTQVTIALNSAAVTQLTEDELHFGLCLNLVAAKNSLVESKIFDLTRLDTRELIAGCEELLPFAIPYCRKVVAFLKNSPRKPSYRDYSIHEHYKNKLEFYVQFIKIVEMHLANKLRYTLAVQTLPSLPLRSDASIASELKQFSQKSRDVIDQKDLLVELPDLLRQLTTMTIKDSAEYFLPTLAGNQLMQQLENCVIDPNNPKHDSAFSELIQCAFEHKVALFDRLYRFGVAEMNRTLAQTFWGPFAELKEQIELLIDSDHRTIYENALNLSTYIKNPAYAALFASDNYKHLKNQLNSKIGWQLDWAKLFNPIMIDPARYEQLIRWGAQDQSGLIAQVLIHLNIYDSSFERNISDDYIKQATSLTIPSKLENNFHVSAILDNIKDAKNKRTMVSIVFDECAARLTPDLVLQFIKSNFEGLTFPKSNGETVAELMGLFNDLHVEGSEKSKNLIYRFYCDPVFEYSLYQLRLKYVAKLNLPYYYGFHNDLKMNATYKYGILTGPFFSFVFENTPSYLPIVEILSSISSNVPTACLPPHYFYTMLQLSTDSPQELKNSVLKLEALNSHLFSTGEEQFVEFAIRCLYLDAVLNPNFKMGFFSTEHCEFLQRYPSSAFVKNFHEGLFARQDTLQEIDSNITSITMTALQFAEVYEYYDSHAAWPNRDVRSKVSARLLTHIKNASEKDRRAALSTCLMKNVPLNDSELLNGLIELWVNEVFAQLGNQQDDGSVVYRLKVYQLISPLDSVSPWIKTEMLKVLANKILSQETLSLSFHTSIEKSFFSDETKDMRTMEYFEGFMSYVCKIRLEIVMIEFLTGELSKDSIETIREAFCQKMSERELVELLNITEKNNEQIDMKFMLVHQVFWQIDIDKRAALVNHLLMPAQSMGSESMALQAYQRAYSYIVNKVLPGNDEQTVLAQALLSSFLKTSNQHTRPYLLASMLAADRVSDKHAQDLPFVLAELAKAFGPAGIKSAQAAHSYPDTPAEFRDALEHLKSSASLPTRWELWQLIKSVVPKYELEKIRFVRTILGGASFYIAVEIIMKNDDIRVLRLLRPNAEQLATYGFAHMSAALQDCQHPKVKAIAPDLNFIVNEAQASATIEVDHLQSAAQYKIAHTIYKAQPKSIVIGGCEFRVKIAAVNLYAVGPGYQLLSKAEGIEFNTLKRDPSKTNLVKAVAWAVCSQEFRQIVSNREFDVDRHGAQSRVRYNEISSTVIEVLVTHYDFGELNPKPATPVQLHHCQKFLQLFYNQLIRNVSSKNLGKEIADFTVAYLQQLSNKVSPDELSRLRSMFKAMMGLQDYFTELKNEKGFAIEMHRILAEQISSVSLLARAGLFANSMMTYFSREEERPNAESVNKFV